MTGRDPVYAQQALEALLDEQPASDGERRLYRQEADDGLPVLWIDSVES